MKSLFIGYFLPWNPKWKALGNKVYEGIFKYNLFEEKGIIYDQNENKRCEGHLKME